MRPGARLFVRFLLLALLGAAACEDAAAVGDGGTEADAAISCGVMPSDGESCATITCPAACQVSSSCNRFCGGGDCYTCSAGTWTRLFYNCIGNVCTPDGGLPVDGPTPVIDAAVGGGG